jgi:Immunity protein 17
VKKQTTGVKSFLAQYIWKWGKIMSSTSGLFCMAAGFFTLAGAYFNWDWFFKSSRAWLFVKLFGRNGARIAYGFLGGFLVLLGVVATF